MTKVSKQPLFLYALIYLSVWLLLWVDSLLSLNLFYRKYNTKLFYAISDEQRFVVLSIDFLNFMCLLSKSFCLYLNILYPFNIRMTRVTITAINAGVARSFIATDTVSVSQRITRWKKFMHRLIGNQLQITIKTPWGEGGHYT